jgi:serine phosphatase RsbU (regulator of sigma subunit)
MVSDLMYHDNLTAPCKEGEPCCRIGKMVVKGYSACSYNELDSEGVPSARLRGRFLTLARMAWMLLFGFPTVLFILATVFFLNAQDLSAAQTVYLVILDVLFVAGYALVALFIAWRRSDDWFALFLSVAMVMTATRFSQQIAFLSEVSPGWSIVVRLTHFFGAFGSLIFLYTFPDGQVVPRRLWPMLIVWFLWVMVWQWAPQGVNPVYQLPLAARLFDLALLSTGIYAQLYRYRHDVDPVHQQQTKWVVYGVTVAIAGYYGHRLLVLLAPELMQPVLHQMIGNAIYHAFLLLIPLSIGFSMLRYRLWDIDPLIHETLVYGTLTAILTAIYLASVVVLQRAFRIVSGQQSDLALVASTLLIAALFQPLRRRVQIGIDRRFYRQKIDVRQALEAFAQHIRTIIDLDDLLSALAERVVELIYTTHAVVYLPDGEGILTLAEQRQAPDAARWRLPCSPPLLLPVEAGQMPMDRPLAQSQDSAFRLLVPLVAPPSSAQGDPELVGVLALGQRLDGRPYSSEEQSLLTMLCDQAGTAVHVAQLVAEKQAVEQELAAAWRIQQSFLPQELPKIPGWQLAAALHPSRETCGDFYDVIPLPGGRIGLLIADVVDKGMAAALYMALSRTILRTYALRHEAHPALVFQEANTRMVLDTQGGHFVTVFYGVLDPVQGTLVYANAGHSPSYVLSSSQEDGGPRPLVRTGVPLGILPDAEWEQETVHLAPGDTLVLYTDGITEAQDRQQVEFGEERLLETLQRHRGRSAQEIQQEVLQAVRGFIGGAAPSDDMALMVLMRPPLSPSEAPEQGSRKEEAAIEDLLEGAGPR